MTTVTPAIEKEERSADYECKCILQSEGSPDKDDETCGGLNTTIEKKKKGNMAGSRPASTGVRPKWTLGSSS